MLVLRQVSATVSSSCYTSDRDSTKTHTLYGIECAPYTNSVYISLLVAEFWGYGIVVFL